MTSSDIPKFTNAVSVVIHDKRFAHSSFNEALSFIVEHAAKVLDCQRVSAWQYHSKPTIHIQCLDLWDKKDKSHSSGSILGVEDASTYLNSLTKDLVIAMNDVSSDPRCIELNATYLPAFGITSMLDAPYQYDGNLAGVLCFEHVGERRTWTAEEQNFAANMAGLLSILTERAKRHSAEEQLQQEKDRYLQLFYDSPYGITIISEGRVVLVNPALQKIVESAGIKSVQGKQMKEIFNLSQARKAYNREKQILSSQQSLLPTEYRIPREDGTYLYLGVSSRFIQWENKDAILSNVQDITEAVNNRKTLELHAAQLQTLADAFPGGFSYLDKNIEFVLVNDILCQWFDFSPDEIIGKSLPDYLGTDVYEQFTPHMAKALAGEKNTFEWTLRHPSAQKREVQFTFVPDLDEENKVKGLFSFILDLTDTKNYERTLRQAQKMEAVGQLTGGISHDFNNLLMIIMGNLEILASEVEDKNSLIQYVENALQASRRGAHLTSKLLGFSGKNSIDSEIININTGIQNILELLKKSLTASINVKLSLAPDLHNVKINGGDLEDCILNMALNSRDAMHGSGTLTITTENRQKNNSEYAVLSISDTGEGIDENLKDKVFEPFFTTKPANEGSGLGLSMVYGFVNRSNGNINLISEKNKGTTFEMYFPIAKEGNRAISKKELPATAAPHGDETILVVDDEVDLIDTVTRILQKKGYRTLSANSAQEALKLITSEEQKIDLLFSDIVLGKGMDGYQLALKCLEISPTLKILLTTGYDKLDNDEQRSKYLTSNRLLKKPYKMDDLARSIRSTLDASNP